MDGRWQLMVLELSSDLQAYSERQLTFGGCNAYTPSWKDNDTVIYATDCERGMGLTALAWLDAARKPRG
jgi:hypothetical protein